MTLSELIADMEQMEQLERASQQRELSPAEKDRYEAIARRVMPGKRQLRR